MLAKHPPSAPVEKHLRPVAAGPAEGDAEPVGAVPTQKLVAGALQLAVAHTNAFENTPGAAVARLTAAVAFAALLKALKMRRREPGNAYWQ